MDFSLDRDLSVVWILSRFWLKNKRQDVVANFLFFGKYSNTFNSSLAYKYLIGKILDSISYIAIFLYFVWLLTQFLAGICNINYPRWRSWFWWRPTRWLYLDLNSYPYSFYVLMALINHVKLVHYPIMGWVGVGVCVGVEYRLIRQQRNIGGFIL